MESRWGYQRRGFLQHALIAGSSLAAPGVWSQISGALQGRLVFVFLRGAYDGLSALVPYQDADYYRSRPSIAIAAPDGTGSTAIALDEVFALHPALKPLMPLWQQGVLSVIPCAGSPDSTRSHFDAQHHWELGIPGKSGGEAGWLNRLAGMHTDCVALGVGESTPFVLAGAAAVQLIPRGIAATRLGILGDPSARDAVARLYAGDGILSRTFQSGMDSRQRTAMTLTETSDNGAQPAQGLLMDAQHLGKLMRRDRRLRFGFLSAGGWDTHANQGSVTGLLAQNLSSLAQALVQLHQDFSEPSDVVIVASEFGRTCSENGTRGTDHGHGNALWVLGDKVNGGRWHGQWDGLAAANLHEGRDLPVHHDFRGVFARVLKGSLRLSAGQIEKLFPGVAWDPSLDSLMRA